MIVSEAVDRLLREGRVSLFASLTKKGYPIVDAMSCHYNGDTVDYGTGISYPAKGERARNNPHVGLFIYNHASPRDGALVIAADATVEDADLQATTDRWIKVKTTGSKSEWIPEKFSENERGVAFSPAEAVFYWVRMWINCTPKKAFYWPNGLEGAPEIWTAGPEVVARASDPAPAGPPTKSISKTPPPWQELADRAAARTDLPPPYLTIVSEGYPLPFVTSGVERTERGFRLAVPAGVPWAGSVGGKACLSFESEGLHVVGTGGRFVGDVEQSGNAIDFVVDHALPIDPIMSVIGQLDSPLNPPPEIREQRMARLNAELKRRGASMPIIRLPEHMG